MNPIAENLPPAEKANRKTDRPAGSGMDDLRTVSPR